MLACLAAVPMLGGCGPERTLYAGGPILTVDAGGRVVEALGVEGDRIAFVGSRADGEAWAGGSARKVELEGRAMVPGFIDAHGHFPGAGLYAVNADLNSPPIGDVASIDELVERVRTRAGELPEGEWVLGWGYDDTLLAEKRHPSRQDLDRATSEHPVVCFHVSGHLVAVNSRALALLGIDASTPDPEGGRIRRDPGSGEPDGVLEENAMHGVTALLGEPSLADSWAILSEGNRRYVDAGVTTAQNGLAAAVHMTGLSWLARFGWIGPRLVLWPGDDVAAPMLEGAEGPWVSEGPHARVGAVKLVADGSIQGYTGYLSQPYHVPPGDDPSYRGYPRIARDELIEKVARYHAAGWQIAVHGNGDASIDDILDAYGEAQRRTPRDDARHVIIHAQMARDDQLDRMRDLGVVPSFFVLHTYYWGDRHREIFMGPERARRMSPTRSAADRGVRFTLHCDSPVVPMEPLRLIWSAVNRLSSSGEPIGPEQRLTPGEALRAVTIDAAWQHFEEADKGSLEVGKLADLVILSRSPLEDPARIDEIRVLETIVGGRTLHRADGT